MQRILQNKLLQGTLPSKFLQQNLIIVIWSVISGMQNSYSTFILKFARLLVPLEEFHSHKVCKQLQKKVINALGFL